MHERVEDTPRLLSYFLEIFVSLEGDQCLPGAAHSYMVAEARVAPTGIAEKRQRAEHRKRAMRSVVDLRWHDLRHEAGSRWVDGGRSAASRKACGSSTNRAGICSPSAQRPDRAAPQQHRRRSTRRERIDDGLEWCALQDSNLGPPPCEGGALPLSQARVQECRAPRSVPASQAWGNPSGWISRLRRAEETVTKIAKARHDELLGIQLTVHYWGVDGHVGEAAFDGSNALGRGHHAHEADVANAGLAQ